MARTRCWPGGHVVRESDPSCTLAYVVKAVTPLDSDLCDDFSIRRPDSSINKHLQHVHK